MNGILNCEKRDQPLLNQSSLTPLIPPLILIFLCLLTGMGTAQAANKFAVSSGVWNQATSIWSNASCTGAAGGAQPNAGDRVIICSGVTVTAVTTSVNDLTVLAGGVLQGSSTTPTLTLGAGGGEDVSILGTVNFSGTTSATIRLNKGSQWGCTDAITGTVTSCGIWNLSTIDLNTKALTFTAGNTFTINLSGAPSPLLQATNASAVTSIATITWNFNGTALQTLPNNATGVIYGNLTANNAAGVTLGNALTATNLLGNLSVSSGILNNGDFAIAGNAAKTFTVANGATFNLTGTSSMVTGFGTRTFGQGTPISTPPCSIVNYGGTAQTVSPESYGNLTLSGSSTKTPATGTINIACNLSLATGVTYAGNTNNPAVNLKGDFFNSGTYTSGSGIFTFNGTAAQTLTGATTLSNMTMNNATGLTINNNLTAASTLTLTSGNISTGANSLIMSANCNTAGAVARTSGHVLGNMNKPVPVTAASITCTWEVGSATAYAPVSNTFASVSTAGTLTVRTDDGDHADTTVGTSGISGTCSINRRWTLTPATMAVTTYSPTFTFVNPGDLDSGVDPTSTSLIVRKKNAGAWLSPTVGTRTSTSTQATGITNAEGFGEFALGYSTATCVVNHFAISHGGSAVNCQAEDITIAAHDATHAIATTYIGIITLSTSTGRGDWSIVAGSGALNNGTVNDGVATYIFVAADNGDVVLGLKDTVAETVNIGVTNGTQTDFSGTSPGTATATEDANLIFAASGFRISDGAAIPAAAIIATQIAGTTSAAYALQAIRTDTSTGACVGVFASGTDVSIDLASQCNNPIACIAGQNVAITNNATTANIASNPNSGVTSYTTRSLRFGVNSQALFTLNYPDVGQISLHARYNIPLGGGGASATNMLGSSNQFVVKPAGFVLSGIQQDASPNLVNPAAADATGAKFVRAGEAFRVTVTAVNSANNATPNYGKEVTPEGVALARSLIAPPGGAAGTLANPSAFGAFSAGVATGITFNWSEVGIITLTPSVADSDYLGAGNTTGATSGNVGRFYAAQFALSGGVIANRTGLAGCAAPAGCGTFTYMGEQMSAVFNLTAKAVDGTTTLQNYNYSATAANNFAKLDPAVAGNPLVLAAVDTGTPRTVATLDTTTYGVASGNFAAGVATVTAPFAVTRGGSASGPFDALDVGANPADSDGAALATLNLAVNAGGSPNTHGKVGSTKARYGRMKLSNAHGSELLPLLINVNAQYWNGATYVTNTLDNNSRFPATLGATGVLDSNYQKNLNLGETSVMTPPASVVFASGVASFRLSAPGANNNGSVDMTVNVLSAYLPSGNTARATFGVYKGVNQFIYLRENY